MELADLLSMPPIITTVDWPLFRENGLDVQVVREDLRHPIVGGNKSWKLKYNLEAFRSSGKKAILSFGGAYSNHLLALSEVCEWYGILLYAIIRGEEKPYNDRIGMMEKKGTRLHYCSRTNYRLKDTEAGMEAILTECGLSAGMSDEVFLVPEGADNESGVRGCTEMAEILPKDMDEIWLACGTGSTLQGIRTGLDEKTRVCGVTAVRNGKTLQERMLKGFGKESGIQIVEGYEEGGYGKSSARLDLFMQSFSEATGIPLEPVYTGKLFHALSREAEKGEINKGSRIAVLHSGGMA
ncbi:MAG: 1-aminocyclopropane-1-carboxylate deaminase/D-cysteine desulfhydrase [Bacteroidota bacterium]